MHNRVYQIVLSSFIALEHSIIFFVPQSLQFSMGMLILTLEMLQGSLNC